MRRCLPHVRGGVSESSVLVTHASLVFPTCVGVFPKKEKDHDYHPGLPHVRGGVSSRQKRLTSAGMSSPRAWGCFLPDVVAGAGRGVFPTCVGVFLSDAALRRAPSCLPHVRGGVSDMGTCAKESWRSSPRAWGCFFLLLYVCHLNTVFPTCVGVFPHLRASPTSSPSLPHVRGGVSVTHIKRNN